MSKLFSSKPHVTITTPTSPVKAVSDLGITILGISIVILALIGTSALVGQFIRSFL